MRQHNWQDYGGCSETPGVIDNGNGGLVYSQRCSNCGSIRRRGKDYTGCRPGNDYPWKIAEAANNNGDPQ
jgi:hypothetical protein